MHSSVRRLVEVDIGAEHLDDVAGAANRLLRAGASIEQDGTGLNTVAPATGTRVSIRIAEPILQPPTQATPYNGPGRVDRGTGRAPGVLRETNVCPRKLGHIVLGSTEHEATIRYFTDLIGFKVSDRIAGDGAFLRFSTDHNLLVLDARLSPATLNGRFPPGRSRRSRTASFADQVPGLSSPYSRRTPRLRRVLGKVALAVGGRPGKITDFVTEPGLHVHCGACTSVGRAASLVRRPACSARHISPAVGTLAHGGGRSLRQRRLRAELAQLITAVRQQPEQLHLLAVAAWILDESDLAVQTFDASLALCSSAGPLPDGLGGVAALAYLEHGRVARAQTLCAELAAVAEMYGLDHAAACANAVNAMGSALCGDTVNARRPRSAVHVLVNRAMFESAVQRILYVDHTKFERRALHALLPLTDFDVVIALNRGRRDRRELQLGCPGGRRAQRAAGDRSGARNVGFPPRELRGASLGRVDADVGCMHSPGEVTLCRLACDALPGVEADHEPPRSETGSI